MAPFAPHQSTRRIAVAVSGGADSMALAHLLSQWGNPHALIVDHGLRRGSADEAALAAARLQARKIPADIITLRHLRPGGQRARHARYDALSDACARLGLTDLATAHHAQDQAETVLIRQAARSGPAGIAGMAASIIHGPVRILRPLLHVAPARLRATLRHAGLAWSEDPSNANPASPRARLRAAFHQTPAMIADALAIAATAGPRRQATEQAIAAELAESCTIYPHGFALTKNLSAPALSALIWTLSGRSHPPAPAAIARLVPLRAATLHGVRISPAGRSGPGWLLTPRVYGPPRSPLPRRDNRCRTE